MINGEHFDWWKCFTDTLVHPLPYDFSLRNRDKLYEELEHFGGHVWITANRVAIVSSGGAYVKELRGTGPDFPWLDHQDTNREAVLAAFLDFQQHGRRKENELLSFACAHGQADKCFMTSQRAEEFVRFPHRRKDMIRLEGFQQGVAKIETCAMVCGDHVRFLLECQQRRIVPLIRMPDNRYLCCPIPQLSTWTPASVTEIVFSV